MPAGNRRQDGGGIHEIPRERKLLPYHTTGKRQQQGKHGSSRHDRREGYFGSSQI